MSRGLGDVYKRQVNERRNQHKYKCKSASHCAFVFATDDVENKYKYNYKP